MTEQEKIQIGAELFLKGENSLTEIALSLKLKTTKKISEYLEQLGYHMYNGAKVSSVINMKKAIEEYVNEETPSITKIASKYKIGRSALSKRLKALGYEVINHQNKVKFDNTIFDCIDTEEKAYWLGFIFADGYVSSTNNEFEISLKADDYHHLEKFNDFMKCTVTNKVKINNAICDEAIYKRCRWSIRDSHLKESLMKLGCVPNKSLILTFPSLDIFKYPKLVKDFIRGYWDGDGSLSWSDKNHTKPCLSILGTEDFLTGVKQNLPLKFDYKLTLADYRTSNMITKCFNVVGENGYELAKYLYENATIYLDRKYERYLQYCRLYEKSNKLLQTNIGEGCDANSEITTETKKSVASYSVESETNKSIV